MAAAIQIVLGSNQIGFIAKMPYSAPSNYTWSRSHVSDRQRLTIKLLIAQSAYSASTLAVVLGSVSEHIADIAQK
jgi:hypothetical protein